MYNMGKLEMFYFFFIKICDNLETCFINLSFYKEVIQASALTVQEHFMENPINAFHFIRRMHDGWPNIIRTIDCDHCKLTDPLRGEILVNKSK
jgi:hypothetical protein